MKTTQLEVGFLIIAFGIVFDFIGFFMLPSFGHYGSPNQYILSPQIAYASYLLWGLGICFVGLFVCIDWMVTLPIDF
jgi:hypothetical protein